MQEVFFEGVTNLIKLPPLIDIPQNKKIFEFNEKEAKQNLPQNVRNALHDLIYTLNNSFKLFSNPQDFEFFFPDSKFDAVSNLQDRNKMDYATKVEGSFQNTFQNQISQEQVNQIEQTGEFEVKSSRPYILQPYVWKINSKLFWGHNKKQEVWDKGLARVFEIVYHSFNQFIQYFIKKITNIKSFPRYLLKLLFGAKDLEVAIQPNYENQIAFDFWQNMLLKCYKGTREEGHALWEYLFVRYDSQNYILNSQDQAINKEKQRRAVLYELQLQRVRNIINSIETVSQKFKQKWIKISNRIFKQICLEFEDKEENLDNNKSNDEERLFKQSNKTKQQNEEAILQKFKEKKFTMYLSQMETKLPQAEIPLDVIEAIITILKLMQHFSTKFRQSRAKFEGKKQACIKQLQSQMPILKHCNEYFQKKLLQRLQPISSINKNQFYEQLTKDKVFQSHKHILQELQSYYKQKSHKIMAKKISLPTFLRPKRIFTSFYMLLPPYQIKLIKTKNCSDTYRLIKQSDELKVNTSQNFWKLSLYWMRAKTWTKNYLIIMLYNLWQSPFGFRCLFGVQNFDYDPYINSQTGQVKCLERCTVLGNFANVWTGILRSRQHFQSLPDQGLFGKKFSRIFNYIECYFFRLIFVGIVLILICYPLAIIIFSTLATVLLVTFWIWIPVIFAVTYLFNILIYQFQASNRSHPFTYYLFPLFWILISFVLNIVTLVLRFVWTFIIVPILALFYFLFKFVQKGCRTISDCVLLFLIRKLGRTPSRDSMIAKKISGPGMSRSFFLSINQNDVYVLTQAKLQMLYMNKLRTITQQLMSQNNYSFKQSMQTVLSVFKSSYNPTTIIDQNLSLLSQRFSQQYYLYMARYPIMPTSIRFTEAQINSFFPNSISIVRNFVEKRHIQAWIFDQHHLEQGNYEELTRCIWISIFNCGEQIFNPLEKIDERFSIENQYQHTQNNEMKSSVSHVMEAIHGEVELSHRVVKVAPLKTNLHSRAYNICAFETSIANMLSLHDSMQSKPTSFPASVFVPHLNIQQRLKYHRYHRERQMEYQSVLIKAQIE